MLKIFQITYTNEFNKQHTMELIGSDITDIKATFTLSMNTKNFTINEIKFIRNFI